MQQNSAAGTRRQWLEGSAAAGALLIVRPETVRGSQANSKISVGLIGAGNRGTYDASIVQADPRAQITALCDPFDDRIETAIQRLRIEGKPAVYKEYQKLLASEVDAVIIATPPYQHPEQFEAAVQARKHIYCEKPMGVDVAGCKRVMAAARRADPKKCITAGFQQRYAPVYLEAYRRIREGEIGELVNARAFWIGGDPFKRVPYADPKIEKLRNWFAYRDYSGDFIVEQDCHNLDVLYWFLGALPIRAVGYAGTKVRTSMEVLDHLTLSYQFPNGMNVNFEANQLSPPGFSRVGEEFTGRTGVIATSRARLVHTRGPKQVEEMPSKREITFDAIEQFLSRILSGEVENTAERSALSTLIGILGRTALYTGREATWKQAIGV